MICNTTFLCLQDGDSATIFRCLHSTEEFVAALKAAAEEFSQTAEGRECLRNLGAPFTVWDACCLVPAEILVKHGILFIENLEDWTASWNADTRVVLVSQMPPLLS